MNPLSNQKIYKEFIEFELLVIQQNQDGSRELVRIDDTEIITVDIKKEEGLFKPL